MWALAAVAAVVVIGAPSAQAQSDSPGPDQYVPFTPNATGKKDKQDANESSNSSGSADDQALDQITGGNSSGSSSKSGDKSGSKDKSSKKDDKSEDSNAAAAAGSGGDDGGDDGALSSASSALTDWDEPLIPGLVALVALFTLGTSIVVLVRRRRTPPRGT